MIKFLSVSLIALVLAGCGINIPQSHFVYGENVCKNDAGLLYINYLWDTDRAQIHCKNDATFEWVFEEGVSIL